MLIPADWQSEGRVDWVNGQLGCPANIIQPRFRAGAADGRSGLEVMPGRVWQSASDGMMLQTMRQSAAAGTGCEVGPVADSIQYLEQMVIPRARAGARIVERKQLPGVARAKQEALEATYRPMVQAGYVRGYKVDAGSVRIEYEQNGQPVEEWLSTSIVSVARPSPNTAALMQGQMNYTAAVYDVVADTVFGLRAPRGSFDERLAATLVASVRPNPAYQAAVGQFLANMGNIQLRGAMDRSRIWSEASAQISATINESYRAQQAVQDRAAENFSQAIRGVQEYKNPRTGEDVQLVGGYNSAWVSPRGEYHGGGEEDCAPGE
jgi:hypothetical protein